MGRQNNPGRTNLSNRFAGIHCHNTRLRLPIAQRGSVKDRRMGASGVRELLCGGEALNTIGCLEGGLKVLCGQLLYTTTSKELLTLGWSCATVSIGHTRKREALQNRQTPIERCRKVHLSYQHYHIALYPESQTSHYAQGRTRSSTSYLQYLTHIS